jgi:hypothetical protein
MHDFLDGARLLGQGWGWWRRRPGVMAAGLVPAALVGLVVLAGIVVLLVNLGRLGDALTPFADDWSPAWERIAEITAGGLVLSAALCGAPSSATSPARSPRATPASGAGLSTASPWSRAACWSPWSPACSGCSR